MNTGGEVRWVSAPDRVRLAVRELGDRSATPLVLLHGYPDTGQVWRPVAERLAADFHVIVPDVRGAGLSDRPRGDHRYRLERLEADLDVVLQATSPGRRVHLVGHDWGAIQCWEAATGTRLAGRIASLTSISGPCLDHAAYWMRYRSYRQGRGPAAWTRFAGQVLRSWYAMFFQLPVLPALVWRLLLAPAWPLVLRTLEGVPRQDGHPARTLPKDAVRGLALYRANFPERLRNPRPRPTEVPVQLVTPTRDAYVSPALAGSAVTWASRVRRRTVRAGHWVPLTHPEQLTTWISAFAGECAATQGQSAEPAGTTHRVD